MLKEIKASNKKQISKRMIVLIILVAVLATIAVYLLITKNNTDDNMLLASEDTIELDGEVEETEEATEDYTIILEDKSKYNISTALSEDKEINGLLITNIQLTYNTNGNSVLLADVTNVAESTIEEKTYTINVVDENGTTITTLPGVVEELEPGESTQLNVSISSDIANAYDFIISE